MRLVLTLLLALGAVGLFAPAQAQDTLVAAAGPSASAPHASPGYVLLKNGEVLRGTVGHDGAAVTCDGRAYELDDVARFGIEDAEYGVVRHPFARGPVVVRRMEEGRINIFKHDGNSDVVYFQKEEGRLTFFQEANLRQALADDPDALRHLDRSRFYGRVGTGAFIAGAALVAAGVTMGLADIEGADPYVVAGSGIGLAAGVNLAIPLLRSSARHRAVATYNR
ncbi:MAG: hypothetical protein R3362_12655 [Rhodothermales bacterium]|nr:hypothetical protein [Rhodothermales bacterium]